MRRGDWSSCWRRRNASPSAADGEAAREAGFADVAGGPGDAAGLAPISVAARLADGRLSLRTRPPSGFEGQLAAAGINCRPIETYDSIARKIDAATAATLIGSIDAVLLYSANAARAFATLFGALQLEAFSPALRLLCLSPRVRDALPEKLRGRAVVAERPEEVGLLELLAVRQSSL